MLKKFLRELLFFALKVPMVGTGRRNTRKRGGKTKDLIKFSKTEVKHEKERN